LKKRTKKLLRLQVRGGRPARTPGAKVFASFFKKKRFLGCLAWPEYVLAE
jgi:hypothetical protein